ncbi:MAG: NAD(P)/FAD-dependent oxidoreductase, partial [Litorimonas sp.]
DTFQGPAFHTARWDHSVDLSGKRVACIGNAASAVQLIPEVAKVAERLTVYHRTPNWIIDKPDRAYTGLEKWIGRRIPAMSKLYRGYLWATGEYILWPAIRGNKLAAGMFRKQHEKKLAEAFPDDPEMHRRLTPDYPVGARRILYSDGYIPALARDNVDSVFDPIDRLSPAGIVAGGVERAHDVIVFSTGFHTNPFLKEIDLTGEDGLSIRDRWAEGAEAYLGVMTSGFPNFFMLYGPNTNLGSNSIVYQLEQQYEMIRKLMDRAGEGEVRVDKAAEAAFNEEVQRRLRDTAWSEVEASWYKDGEKITSNWPGPVREYKRRATNPDFDHFEFSP